MKENQIGYFFIVTASIFIVMAGIKSASVIIVPFLLSLFLAIILLPFYSFFTKKGLADSLSLSIVIALFMLLILFVVKLIGSSIHQFNANLDFYTQQLSIYFKALVIGTTNFGITIPVENFSDSINSKQIMSFATKIMQSLGEMFSDGFVVLFTVIFMLVESSLFSKKIKYITKHNATTSHIQQIIIQIKEYMVLKTIMSALTGFIVWIALSLVGTDYPFLWAVIAFLFNFIPNIGSIIAAVPAVLLSLIQLGVLSASIVAAIYVVVNIVIGSILEPRVMGRGLGLSSLVVFLSLLFWGWLLGIVGMLLSIPLTIMIKIILDDYENTRWISVLLGTGDDISDKKGSVYDRKFKLFNGKVLNQRNL